ncbi:MAG: LLM class F420-dependent oxidoreductase [Acidimicrobiia bacterium]|nr:LLM class F420-dependent oxidoreductase [Acidimicrobiia bacterium]
MHLTGSGVWSAALRYGDSGAAAEAATELEQLGYAALWIPDIGGDVFASVANLLAATSTVTIATGILNLWMHSAEETAARHAELSDTHGRRFLAGIGVSHHTIVDRKDPGRYGRPLAHMVEFLDGLDDADVPLPVDERVLAALGPKMLDLAHLRAAGVHPYLVTTEHTHTAREALGPEPMVLPEQAVALTTDRTVARDLGRQHLAAYIGLPNYENNWRRLGFTDDDLGHGGSDRLVDALVAWGDDAAIASRVQEHRDAGADHVCVQVLTADRVELPLDAWRHLAPALT